MIRIISRLDIKSRNLIKGKQFEGLRKLGDPKSYAVNYYEEGIDEIFLIDNVASLYRKNFEINLLDDISKKILIPITAAGGIDDLEIAKSIFKYGADKIAINSNIINNLSLLEDLVNYFGSSNIIVSIEAKKNNKSWEIYSLGGREKSNISIENWIENISSKLPGEIYITSIDYDGMQNGFCINLFKKVNRLTNIPIIVGGGFGQISHIDELLENCQISAVTIGSALHNNSLKIMDLKEHVYKKGFKVRI